MARQHTPNRGGGGRGNGGKYFTDEGHLHQSARAKRKHLENELPAGQLNESIKSKNKKSRETKNLEVMSFLEWLLQVASTGSRPPHLLAIKNTKLLSLLDGTR